MTKIYHWDEVRCPSSNKNNRIFFIEVEHEIYFKATKENSPGERHLYKVIEKTKN